MEIFQHMTVQGQRKIIDLFNFCAFSISDTSIQVFLCAHGGQWLPVPPHPPSSPGGFVQELTLVGSWLS